MANKVMKELTWDNYSRLVYKIAHQFYRRLPGRQKALIEVDELVNHCACRWEYLVSRYDPQYQFSTLLTTACCRILGDFVRKEWKGSFIVEREVHIGPDGETLDLLEQYPTERVHDHSLVGLDSRFLRFFQMASPPLKHFLRYYVLEGRYRGGNIKPMIKPVREEIISLCKRFELGPKDLLLFYGSQPHLAGRPKAGKPKCKPSNPTYKAKGPKLPRVPSSSKSKRVSKWESC